nr:HEAT repeat domain-containing protein [Methanoculleus sp. FWC-SCC1]
MAIFDRFRPNIGRLKEDGDLEGLVRALAHDSPDIRREAAAALCGAGAAAVPLLVKALNQAGPEARGKMAEGLASVDASSLPLILSLLIQTTDDARYAVADAVAGNGDTAFEAFVPALRHERPVIRLGAAIALAGMGKRAVPPLRELLGDPDRLVRREAARSLSRLKWKPGEPDEAAEFYFLTDDWKELVRLKNAAFPVLSRGLAEKEARVRRESARALGRLGSSRAVPGLVKALGDPDTTVRVAAVEALGELRDVRAQPPLLRILDTDCHQVRMETAWALDRLGWRPDTVLQRIQYLIAKEQWTALAGMGRAAVEPLILALREDHSGVRAGATEALRKIGVPGLEGLSRACRSKDPVQKKAAARALLVIKRLNEDEARARPVMETSDVYEREIKEGLAIQQRFEKRYGKPTYQAKKNEPAKPKKEAPPPPTPGAAEQQAPAAPAPPKQEDLADLIRQNRRAMERWAQTKGELREPVADAKPAISLDQLIPPEFDEELFAGAEADEEAVEVLVDDAKPQLTTFDIPEKEPAEEEVLLQDLEPEIEPESSSALERSINALRDPDETIRAAAVEALRAMGEAAVDPLIGALSDKAYVVRIAAAEALGDMGYQRAVPPLIAVLRDTDQDVRIAAAAALGRLADPRAIRPLIALFDDPYYGVRNAAADALAAIGEDAFDALVAVLGDRPVVVRITAARALGEMKDRRAVPPLVDLLSDPAAEVRWAAAQAVGGLGEAAIAPLSLVLKNGSKNERLAAIDALWKITDDRATEALMGGLHDEDADVRAKASEALKKRQVLDVWRRAFGEQMEEETAAPKKKKKKKKTIHQDDRKAFEEHGQQEISRLIDALREKTWTSQLGAATRLIMMGRPAVEGLIRALKDEDSEIQMAAASVLGEMRDVAVDPLMDALHDDDRYVRMVAARNLGKIGNDRSIEVLVGALHSERDAEVRAVVAEALGYMGKKQAIEPLVLALRDRDEAVQMAAARSLGYIGDRRAIRPLIQALNDVDDRVRRVALEALRDPDGLVQNHLMEALMHGDAELKMGVAEALDSLGWTPSSEAEQVYYAIARERWAEVEQIGPAAVETLGAELENPSTDVRMSAVKTIARIGGAAAAAPLVRALADDHIAVRRRAEQALVGMGASVRESLQEALDDAESGHAAALRRILEKIGAETDEKSDETVEERGGAENE